MAVNAHRAFYSAGSNENYLGNLTVDHDVEVELRGVRDKIRATLSEGFRDWGDFIEKRELFETAALSFADQEPLRPKFRMQGSWAYHTLNRTTVEPPQEIDLDDGMFLPMSFLTQDGTAHPAIVSRSYFDAVEAMLTPLCNENGWALDPMPSCVRVEVRPGAHVDIALYAIPDDDFSVLVEKAALQSSQSFGFQARDEAQVFDSQIYPNLPPDHIMLAHREEGWKPSDPRKLEDWFSEAIKTHDFQLRRVCRYLKGWRDSQWDGCRLSSIALMSCVITAYDSVRTAPPTNRDDLALQMVADALPLLLADRIENPVVPNQYLDEKWSPDERADFVAAAKMLRTGLQNALGANSAASAISTLRGALGNYVPEDEAVVAVETLEAPTILTTGMLKELGAEPKARSSVKIGGDDRYG